MAMSEHGTKRQDFLAAMPFGKDAKARREAALIAPYLDAKFYLENNADVAAAGLDASYHYAKFGWREGRDPSPSFSTSGYLMAHPALASAGTNPLVHFAQNSGRNEGAAPPVADERLDAEIALVSDHVDDAFYRRTYPATCAGGVAPAEHYCRTGWREGNDPAPEFSTSYYLTTNPDIKESGVNPFWHYLIAGRDEGRLPTHPGGWRHGVLSRQTTFEAHCANWLRPQAPPPLLSEPDLLERLDAMREAPGMMISVGHDDYRATPGGVQLCVEIEERDAVSHGVDYLNLHPWQPLPKLADAEEDGILCLVLNGKTLGATRAGTLAAALAKLPDRGGDKRMVIHHLAGHAPEAVATLAESFGITRAHFWLHDYFTLCTSYALQRNNVTPCGVPDAASNACRICIFGEERVRQQDRIARLFERLDIDMLSPSKVALEFWSARTALPAASGRVHPHMRLTPVPVERASEGEGPVRIAFIGTPAAHKGWPAFLELKRRLAGLDGYEFWFFGTADPGLDGIRRVETHVRASDPDSTLSAIADHGIDIVLHWASWRETFSFSTFEALGGGAFVLTNEGSGNVAAAVEASGQGVVLKDADALYALAKSGGLADLADRARHLRATTRFDAEFSGMTHDLCFEEVLA